MKKLLLASTMTVLTMTSALITPTALAEENIAQSICEYIAADDKNRMRSYLKSNNLKIRNIFSGIQCNGQNLLQFAQTAGSVEIGSLMISKLPKDIVSENLAHFQTGTPLFDAANERVSS